VTVTGRCAGVFVLLLLVLRSWACSVAISLSFADSCEVKVEFVLVRVRSSYLSAVAAMARLANASAVLL
jgi:hypothetical protein